MKKIYCYLLGFIFVAQLAQAQNAATPNPGFENWTQVGNHYDPDNWNTLNPNTGIIGVFTCTRATGADVHSGSYAIKLTTKSVFGITANGIASTATLITTPPYGVTGGLAYTQRPDSIVGWFKYTPATAADSGFVQFVLLDAVNDTVGFVKFNTPNVAVGTYARFSKPITYFSPATPALSYWILSSSDGVNPVVNSSIIVDDIDLVFNSSGTSELNTEAVVAVLNSMITDIMTVRNYADNKVWMQLYDQSGRLIRTIDLEHGTHDLDMNWLTKGVYFYQLYDTGLEIFDTGKLLKM